MITRPLLEHIFAAASIERWNDHPHPAVFTELGKQAHKMVVAWVLGRAEEDAGCAVDWNALIEGGIFEFMYRVVVTTALIEGDEMRDLSEEVVVAYVTGARTGKTTGEEA